MDRFFPHRFTFWGLCSELPRRHSRSRVFALLEVPKYASAAVALSGSVLSRRREDIFLDDLDRAMG
jgi:hypothetical protein